MIDLDINAIQGHLKKNNVDIQLQAETGQLYYILKIEKAEYPVFIRIIPESELIQLLAFIPCNFTSKTVSDTARLLHFLNKEIDTPGFGMDENASVVFYRCMLPAKAKKIDTQVLTAYLNAIEFVASSFGPLVGSVAHGLMSFDEVVKKAKEAGVST